MKGGRVATIIGVVCGAELLIAAVVGGAGIGAFFGWNGLIVAAAVAVIVGGLIHRRRRSDRGTAEAPVEADRRSRPNLRQRF